MVNKDEYKIWYVAGAPQGPSQNYTHKKSGHGRGIGYLPKIFGSPLIFLQRVKIATLTMANNWGLPRSIIKTHSENKVGVGLGYGSSPNLGVPFNIFVISKASDSKFGMELGFAKSNYKIIPKDKSGHVSSLGRSQIWNTAWVCQLRPLQYQTMTKVGHGMVLSLESLQNSAFSVNIFAMSEIAMVVPNKRCCREKNRKH